MTNSAVTKCKPWAMVLVGLQLMACSESETADGATEAADAGQGSEEPTRPRRARANAGAAGDEGGTGGNTSGGKEPSNQGRGGVPSGGQGGAQVASPSGGKNRPNASEGGDGGSGRQPASSGGGGSGAITQGNAGMGPSPATGGSAGDPDAPRVWVLLDAGECTAPNQIEIRVARSVFQDIQFADPNDCIQMTTSEASQLEVRCVDPDGGFLPSDWVGPAEPATVETEADCGTLLNP